MLTSDGEGRATIRDSLRSLYAVRNAASQFSFLSDGKMREPSTSGIHIEETGSTSNIACHIWLTARSLTAASVGRSGQLGNPQRFPYRYSSLSIVGTSENSWGNLSRKMAWETWRASKGVIAKPASFFVSLPVHNATSRPLHALKTRPSKGMEWAQRTLEW